MRGRDREGEVPRDPLNKGKSTVSKFPDSLRIAFHVELGDDDVSEFDANIFHVPPLNGE